MNKLSAGKDVDSYCTKCRLELGHLIVAMVGSEIAKVKCNTCGSVHNYREMKKPVQKVSSSGAVKRLATSKVGKETEKAPEVLWQECIFKARGAEVPYDMGKSFKVGDILVHELFGKGVVLQVSPKKCTARFSDKERVMVTSN